MTNRKICDPKLRGLQKISGVILDRRLALLQACLAARSTSLQLLQDLEPKESGEKVEPIALAKSNLQYQAWVDRRRAEINILLARQTVDLIEARKMAMSAFGRADVIRHLIVRNK